ncbi:HNH endonuclease signature motif containing protein [Mycobacterium sp. NPDC048908]|uniref:HNH endonuclease signature motif containing protein n=1 Tax=Mycobacterium sp. NPDC048908 TaxID=3364292 RepID=UPI00371B54D6
MFENCEDVGLLDLMSTAQRDERAACARQLLAIGAFTVRRIAEQTDDQGFWVVDGWEQIAAEVSAELGLSRKRASSRMHYGQSLIERLPKLSSVFAAGLVDFRIIAAAIFRTGLITDADALAAVDEQLTAKAPGWNALSQDKITELVDWMVIELDPDAVRVANERDADLHIEVRPGQNGTAEIWGEVRSPDGAAFDASLDNLAATVCPNDPRTHEQRRTDALGPLSARATTMPCLCDAPDCTAAGDGRVPPVVITVIADAATVEGRSDTPGYLPGYGALPAQSVRDLAKTASLRPVPVPKDLADEPNYRPSAALTRFLQARDLTCTFPGCDHPAAGCDIDHSVPWPYGPTHPSNTSHKCRIHHLLKTFCGWLDVQLPDGTVIWRSPRGRLYPTKPLGVRFFPQLATPTETLVLSHSPPTNPNRGLAMPRRKRTRSQDRAYRIEYERAQNHARYAADPPPF